MTVHRVIIENFFKLDSNDSYLFGVKIKALSVMPFIDLHCIHLVNHLFLQNHEAATSQYVQTDNGGNRQERFRY